MGDAPCAHRSIHSGAPSNYSRAHDMKTQRADRVIRVCNLKFWIFSRSEINAQNYDYWRAVMIWESFNSKQWTMEIPISFAGDLGPSVELFSVRSFFRHLFTLFGAGVHSMRIDSTDHHFFFIIFADKIIQFLLLLHIFLHSVIWYRIVSDKMYNEVWITTVYVRRRKCEKLFYGNRLRHLELLNRMKYFCAEIAVSIQIHIDGGTIQWFSTQLTIFLSFG